MCAYPADNIRRNFQYANSLLVSKHTLSDGLISHLNDHIGTRRWRQPELTALVSTNFTASRGLFGKMTWAFREDDVDKTQKVMG